MMCWTRSLAAALALMTMASCSSSSEENNNNPDVGMTIMCPAGQTLDESIGRCVREMVIEDAGPDLAPDIPPEVDVAPDTPTDEGGSGDDGGEDMPRDEDMAAEMSNSCDVDGDLEPAMRPECGGMDCDDNDFQRTPGRVEVCDDIDNDCSGAINDGITCTFVAHTRDEILAIDPFLMTSEKIADMPSASNAIKDVDTHPDGRLFGVTSDELQIYDPSTMPPSWRVVGPLDGGRNGQGPGDPNGLAIDQGGLAYVTSEDELYVVNLDDGSSTFVGRTGQFTSSGDAVVNKQNTLYMTSKRSGMDDELVEVDRTSGNGTKVGDISGYSRVFGLTFAWGKLWGLTVEGELLLIDRSTAQPQLIHTFEDNGQALGFFGAASTPDR